METGGDVLETPFSYYQKNTRKSLPVEYIHKSLVDASYDEDVDDEDFQRPKRYNLLLDVYVIQSCD